MVEVEAWWWTKVTLSTMSDGARDVVYKKG